MEYILFAISAGISIVFVVLFLNAVEDKGRLRKKKRELEESYEQLEESYEVLENRQIELTSLYEKTKQEEERVRKIAYMDALTQLPNRDAITNDIEQYLKNLPSDGDVCLMYLDVDNLKQVNDTLGYTYGDELLIDITYRIKQLLSEDDKMARMSGDEFAILTQNVEDVTAYEDKIKKILTVFNFPFSLAEKECFITVSIGVCKLNKEIRNAQMAIKQANAAMFEAKEMGNSQYCYFNEDIKERQTEQIQKQADIRSAFENEEFYEVYQPVLDMKEHTVIGFEMLLRWNHPVSGVLLPHEFLPVANESGVIVPLGIHFLRQACNNLLKWQKQGYPDLMLMINLSERQLLDYDLVADVQVVLKEIPVEPSQIAFDISELTIDENEQVITERISQLKALGVKIILDQFGVEKGATYHFAQQTYEFVKIDASLISDITVNETRRQFLYDLTSMIENQKSRVIYEGIEVPEQLEILEGYPSALVQGFLFGNPLTSKEVTEYLSTWMK